MPLFRQTRNIQEYCKRTQQRILNELAEDSSSNSQNTTSESENESVENQINNALLLANREDRDVRNEVTLSSIEINSLGRNNDIGISNDAQSGNRFSITDSDNSSSTDCTKSGTTDSTTSNTTDSTDGSTANFDDSDFDSSSTTGSESESEIGDNEGLDEDPPLFEGAPLTLSESLLSILSVTLRHSLSGVVLASILELIALHCPEPNHCRSTLYTFKKYFESLHSPVKRHYYCSYCLTPHEQEFLQCPKCEKEIESDYFLTISIIDQLKAMYKRKGFYQKLQHRFTRRKLNEENIEDIYDGEVYKELNNPGQFLTEKDNITFSWYTDGVRVFNSSKFSFWPVYLTINELPYEDRFKKENLILLGMWFGVEKPDANLFLSPAYQEIKKIYNGIAVETDDNENPVNIRGLIICGSCDLPAKAIFLNMNQYNGHFGCHKCTQKGLRIGNIQVYPYMKNMPLRTEEETLQNARIAATTNKTEKGVKGRSILSILVYKWIRTTGFDVMHNVFLGVFRMLLCFWFDNAHAGNPFSFAELTELLDDRIRNICSPSFVQRRPTPIKSTFKYWKASTFKNFFFYHSLPILEDILSPRYFDHFKLLVGAIFLLCQSSISEEMLSKASRMLHEFVGRFQYLYGLENMTNNIHTLLHLPLTVKQLGPLFIYSCFTYEDINGKLKMLVHGSKCAQLQICFGASLYINTFTLHEELLQENSKAYKFCKKFLSPRKQKKLSHIGNSVFIAGALTKLPVPNTVLNALQTEELPLNARYIVFKKLYKNKMLYTSEIYTQAKVTNSSYVQYNINNRVYFGQIHLFLKATNCQCHIRRCQCQAVYYAVIKKFTTTIAFPNTVLQGIGINFLYKIDNIIDEFAIVNIEHLYSVCFLTKICHENDRIVAYIAQPVNLMEKE